VNELGVFAMLEQGLKEVRNPSAIFLNRGSEEAPGSAVMVVWEGTRPLLVEIQALVDDSQGSYPGGWRWAWTRIVWPCSWLCCIVTEGCIAATRMYS